MNVPLRIALLTHSLRPRGGVVHTLELAHALQSRGHAITVLAAAEPGETLFRATTFPVKIIQLPALSGDLVEQVRQRIATLVDDLPPLLRAGGYDLLHAQDSLSGNALATLREQRMNRSPWLRTVHHLDLFEQPLLNAWQERAWRSADGVACVSDGWWSHFVSDLGCPAQRMFNGVDLDRFRPPRPFEPHAGPDPQDTALLSSLGVPARTGPLCLLVGGVEHRKNSVRLLQAFGRLRHDDPAWADARLVVAGGASMLDHGSARAAWQQVLADSGLAEGPGLAVHRTGPLPDALLPALMRRASVLAMPSLVEGFGLAALEALACGTPVLVSRRAPFTEHLHDTPAVAWCDPEDPASIAAGLQQAAQMPRLPGPPPVCVEHGWARSAERHEAWYGRVLQGAQPMTAARPAAPESATT